VVEVAATVKAYSGSIVAALLQRIETNRALVRQIRAGRWSRIAKGAVYGILETVRCKKEKSFTFCLLHQLIEALLKRSGVWSAFGCCPIKYNCSRWTRWRRIGTTSSRFRSISERLSCCAIGYRRDLSNGWRRHGRCRPTAIVCSFERRAFRAGRYRRDLSNGLRRRTAGTCISCTSISERRAFRVRRIGGKTRV